MWHCKDEPAGARRGTRGAERRPVSPRPQLPPLSQLRHTQARPKRPCSEDPWLPNRATSKSPPAVSPKPNALLPRQPRKWVGALLCCRPHLSLRQIQPCTTRLMTVGNPDAGPTAIPTPTPTANAYHRESWCWPAPIAPLPAGPLTSLQDYITSGTKIGPTCRRGR